jgi:hypothetical protein
MLVAEQRDLEAKGRHLLAMSSLQNAAIAMSCVELARLDCDAAGDGEATLAAEADAGGAKRKSPSGDVVPPKRTKLDDQRAQAAEAIAQQAAKLEQARWLARRQKVADEAAGGSAEATAALAAVAGSTKHEDVLGFLRHENLSAVAELYLLGETAAASTAIQIERENYMTTDLESASQAGALSEPRTTGTGMQLLNGGAVSAPPRLGVVRPTTDTAAVSRAPPAVGAGGARRKPLSVPPAVDVSTTKRSKLDDQRAQAAEAIAQQAVRTLQRVCSPLSQIFGSLVEFSSLVYDWTCGTNAQAKLEQARLLAKRQKVVEEASGGAEVGFAH